MIKITRTRFINSHDVVTLETEVQGELESELVRRKVLNQIRQMDLLLWGIPTVAKSLEDNTSLDLSTVTVEDIQEDMLLYPETWITD